MVFISDSRLIPAGAGSTLRPGRLSTMHTAHPRRGGEHGEDLGAYAGPEGSSPPGRGAQPTPWRSWGRAGLIPAGAGSTAPSPCCWRWTTAHPRRGGEHARVSVIRNGGRGSSPPGRGARQGHAGGSRGLRLIPAGAGSTRLISSSSPVSRAHPRRGGEHSLYIHSTSRSGGSSPPGRGAPRHPGRRTRPGGLIPAGAGSTVSAGRVGQPATAHPRRGGEHTC